MLDRQWVLGDKNARNTVERFFDVIASHFAHRLPGTTGSDPHSIERVLNDPKGNLSLLMTFDELQQVIDVVVSNSNARRLPSLGSRTPLEAMHHLLASSEGFVRTLPEARRRHLNLLQECRELPVRGNRDRGSAPHVNFSYVSYRSNRLSRDWGLLQRGTPARLRIYFDVRDIRHLYAYTTEGAFYDTLTADRPWCFSSHSLWLRKEIYACYRKGLLKRDSTSDPVHAFWKYMQSKAKGDRHAASDVARVLIERSRGLDRDIGALPLVRRPALDVQAVPIPRADDGPPLSEIFTY